MKKQSWRIPMVAVVLTILLGMSGVLVSSPRAKAHPIAITEEERADGTCSNRTLRGDYGFAIEGQFLAPAPVAGQLRGVAMTHFDGEGNLSQVVHIVLNGTAPPIEFTPQSGTYTINPDCTGTMRTDQVGSPFPPVLQTLVVVRQGREIHTVVDNTGGAVTSVGIKRD